MVVKKDLDDLRGFVDAVYDDVIALRKRVKALEGKCSCDSNVVTGSVTPTTPEVFTQVKIDMPDSLGWRQVAYWWEKDGWRVWSQTVLGTGMVWVYRSKEQRGYEEGLTTLMDTVRKVDAIIADRSGT